MIQVFSEGTELYTYNSIYGYYFREEDLKNGRAWYKNDNLNIWWDQDHPTPDGVGVWKLGSTLKPRYSKQFHQTLFVYLLYRKILKKGAGFCSIY